VVDQHVDLGRDPPRIHVELMASGLEEMSDLALANCRREEWF
jgi:hypothetical protein